MHSELINQIMQALILKVDNLSASDKLFKVLLMIPNINMKSVH